MKLLKLLFFAINTLSAFTICGQNEILYAGTYSQRESQGIYVFNFNRNTGSFQLIQTTPMVENPNFLVINKKSGFLYAVHTIKGEGDKNTDVISSFKIDTENGKLIFINHLPTYGFGACHISIDNTGKWIFVSHYNSGSVTEFSINGDGSIRDTVQTIKFKGSSITRRQESSHVHSALVSPDNKFLFIADLGTDKIMTFPFDVETGKFTPSSGSFLELEKGSGPRHFTFHATNDNLYLANELNSTVTVLLRNENSGALTKVQTISTLPATYSGRNLVADIHISPDGKFLYVTNRGHNSIAVFQIHSEGNLEFISHQSVMGDHPRNFLIDEKGEFILVANQNSDNIVVLSTDKITGKLNPTGNSLKVPASVCLKWFSFN
jgi:6-phosphogluconolactonase